MDSILLRVKAYGDRLTRTIVINWDDVSRIVFEDEKDSPPRCQIFLRSSSTEFCLYGEDATRLINWAEEYANIRVGTEKTDGKTEGESDAVVRGKRRGRSLRGGK